MRPLDNRSVATEQVAVHRRSFCRLQETSYDYSFALFAARRLQEHCEKLLAFLLLQITTAILKGKRLPLPNHKALPGPRPKSSDTLAKYIELMQHCTDLSQGKRPDFIEVNRRLNELAVAEVAAAELAAAGVAAGQ